VGIVAASASPEPVGVGLSLTYTAEILNEGPKPATAVTCTDTLPNGVTFVSATTTQGACTQSHGIVACDIGSLASAFDATVNIVVNPTATGTLANNMNVTSAGQDLVSTNNTANQNTSVVPIFSFTVVKTGTGSGTVTSSPAGIECGGACSQRYASGTSISLTAVPSAGSQFSGWSGACTGADPNSCAVTLISDQSVTATFAIPPDFSVSPSAASLTVERGGKVSDALTFPAQGGFSGAITPTCSVTGTVPMPTCSISPKSVSAGGTATLTINASNLTASLAIRQFEGTGTLYAGLLPIGLLGCVLATEIDKKRRHMWLLVLLVMAATVLPARSAARVLPVEILRFE